MTRMTRKDVSTVATVLSLAREWRDREIGRRQPRNPSDIWPDIPPKLMQAKLDWLFNHYVTSNRSGYTIDSPTQWLLPEAEKAPIVAALTADGFVFDEYQLVLTEEEQKERSVNRAKAHESYMKALNDPGVLGYLLRRTKDGQDALARDFEQYLLTGKVGPR